MNFIYILGKLIIYPTSKIFYKKVKIVGLENVVNNKPVFLYGNHNNAFIDSIVVHFALHENIYTLTRGDVFNSKIKAFFLSKFNILPIYRLREGKENLHKNQDSFSKTIQLLKEKNKVLIFPEGDCVQEKQLRKFKKGMARMAFSSEIETDFTLGLQIQPIAINYSKPYQFRSSYELVIGKSINLKDYEQEYKLNPSATINKFNADCEAKLADLMVIINHKKNEALHDLCCEMFIDDKITPKAVAIKINELSDEDATELDTISKKYIKQLEQNKIRDWVVAENELGFGKVMYQLLILLVTFPIYIIGLLLNYLTFKLPYLLTLKVCKSKEFYSSINMSVGGFLWVIFYVLYILISSAFITNGYLFALNHLLMPLTGLFALWYWQTAKKVIGKLRWLSLLRNKKEDALQIVALRKMMVEKYKLN